MLLALALAPPVWAADATVPRTGVLAGLATRPATAATSTAIAARFADAEARAGRRLAIADIPLGWRGPLPLPQIRSHLAMGRLPMLTWGAVDVRAVDAGAYDTSIASRARALARLRGPVLLRLFPAMDAPVNATRARSPAAFGRAFARVDRMLREAGARNVRLVWCPTAAAFADGRAERWLPAGAGVDWICASVDGTPAGAPAFAGFDEIATPVDDLAARRRLPAMLADVRARERAVGRKAAWLGTLAPALEAAPQVRAVVFGSGVRTGYATSRGTIAAFRAAVRAPRLAARVVQGLRTARRPKGKLVPPTGVLLGAYTTATSVPPSHAREDLLESLAWLERRAGRKLDIYHYYYAWKAEFPRFREAEWGVAEGRIPMVSWDGADVRLVNDGVYDDLIRARAAGVRDLGSPIFIRWMAEMDGNFRRPLARTPAEFIAAWRRIVSIFRSEGADNAVWVWCPNVYGVEFGNAPEWYPGGAYVDWVCGDGYNWAVARPGARWRSFADTFAAWYAWGSSLGKPMMIGETGTMEGSPGQKAAWIDGMRLALKTTMPMVAALVLFDTWDRREYDWRLRTSTSSAEALSRLGRDPWFRPRDDFGPSGG